MKHQFDDKVAELYGVDIALLVDNIAYFIKQNVKSGTPAEDGEYWMTKSQDKFSDRMSYMTRRKVGRVLDKAEKSGAIVSKKKAKYKGNQTKSYALLCPQIKKIYLPNMTNLEWSKVTNEQWSKVTNHNKESNSYSNPLSIKERIEENSSFKNLCEKILPDGDFLKIGNLFAAARLTDGGKWEQKSDEALLARWEQYLTVCRVKGYNDLKKSVSGQAARRDAFGKLGVYRSPGVPYSMVKDDTQLVCDTTQYKAVEYVSQTLLVFAKSNGIKYSFPNMLVIIKELLPSFGTFRLCDFGKAINFAHSGTLEVEVDFSKSLTASDLLKIFTTYRTEFKGFFAKIVKALAKAENKKQYA